MKRPQQGIALITAILVVSLAAIAAAAILGSANVAVHRAANLQDSEKAWWYAAGVESWVKSGLERDLDDNKIDTLKDVWARPVDYLPVDQGFVRGAVVDLQGRFNVNNLGTDKPELYKAYSEQFERLLAGIEGVDPFQAKALASAIRDWIDKDTEPTGFDGAEDTVYEGIAPPLPPYRVPNRPMESITELLAVRGMTRELYLKLTQCAVVNGIVQSCVTALPQFNTPININTAPEPVLRSLVKQSRAEFDQFLVDRIETPAESVNEALQQGVFMAGDFPAPLKPEDFLAVASQFFLLRAEATIGAGRVALFSFFFRPPDGRPVVIGHSTDME